MTINPEEWLQKLQLEEIHEHGDPSDGKAKASFAYSEVGRKLKKRLTLHAPYEQKLQASISEISRKIDIKIAHHTRHNNKAKLRKYLRDKWVIVGIQQQNLEFKIILEVHKKFTHLDLVPSEYYYPEFY